jgi:hypothetical protein
MITKTRNGTNPTRNSGKNETPLDEIGGHQVTYVRALVNRHSGAILEKTRPYATPEAAWNAGKRFGANDRNSNYESRTRMYLAGKYLCDVPRSDFERRYALDMAKEHYWSHEMVCLIDSYLQKKFPVEPPWD